MSELRDLEHEIQQLQSELARDIDGIQRKDPAQRTKEINRCQNKLISIKIRIESLELETLQLNREEKAQHSEVLKQIQNTFKELKKDLDRKKGEKVVEISAITDEDSNKNLEDMDGQELIKAGDKMQRDGMDALQRIMGNIHSADQKADQINLELYRQDEQMHKIQENTRDIQSELKKAAQFLKYFAKSVYTDKLLGCLTFLVAIALLVIIIIKIAKKKGVATPSDLVNAVRNNNTL